jgi:hypothetical protein
MADTPQDEDAELAAIATIGAVLGKLPDADARRRVLNYVLARYLPEALSRVQPPAPMVSGAPAVPGQDNRNEIPGVARVTDTGDLVITARDLKARSALDAAVRLAHVSIYAHHQLTGQHLSSRKGLTPLLKAWRVYDGNTRARLAKDRGIIRTGDSLMLDAHARRDAERYVEEILNDEVTGQWRAR